MQCTCQICICHKSYLLSPGNKQLSKNQYIHATIFSDRRSALLLYHTLIFSSIACQKNTFSVSILCFFSLIVHLNGRFLNMEFPVHEKNTFQTTLIPPASCLHVHMKSAKTLPVPALPYLFYLRLHHFLAVQSASQQVLQPIPISYYFAKLSDRLMVFIRRIFS